MKISIITPVYNRADFIENCIESVICQNYSDIEYIIIDGGSTDGTVDKAMVYQSKIDFFISEADSSMYDAINKGIKLATGHVIGVLNSDDRLSSPKTISLIAEQFTDPNILGTSGNLRIVEEGQVKNRKLWQVGHDDLVCFGKGTILPHPTVYLRAEIYKNNLYNLEYRYASDFDFLLRITKSFEVKFIDEFIVDFYRHENTITASGLLLDERKEIMSHYRACFARKLYLYARYFFKNKILTK
ncbi:glycosyltransferase [Akkermansiaceae bacterium]|nr:glycosyltransferase [Akkermansiaceae bacterium]MDA7872303.1 glycosyltransferase [Akkermansiaceae bacterium]